MPELSNKTVLITGATGLIGSHLVDALVAMENVNVIALGRDKEKLKRAFGDYAEAPNFKYIAQDVCEPIDIPDDTPIDFIFHAASLVGGRHTAERPLDAINPNLTGTKNCFDLLLRQYQKTGVNGRMVLFSSVTVYGNMTGQEITVTEEDTAVTEKLDAKSAPYSQAKRIAEVMALAYHRQLGLDVVIVRPSTVYGPTRFTPNTVFYEFLESALAGQDIVINNPAAARRDNIYIDDVISALLCVSQKGVSGQAYNISSNGQKENYMAVDEIARSVADAVNSLLKREKRVRVLCPASSAQNRAPGIKLDNTKLMSLGWELRTSAMDGIMRTVSAKIHNGFLC